MSTIAWPFAFTLFAWWFSTGAILYLDGLPRRTFRWTLAAATALCALGVWGLAISSARTTPASAYCAFTCALLVWAWQEIASQVDVVVVRGTHVSIVREPYIVPIAADLRQRLSQHQTADSH